MKVPLDGGSATTLASGTIPGLGIAVASTSVYWTDLGPGTAMKVLLDGGSPTTLVGTDVTNGHRGGRHERLLDQQGGGPRRRHGDEDREVMLSRTGRLELAPTQPVLRSAASMSLSVTAP